MILLDSTTRTLQVILGGAKATNDCPWVSCYADIAQTGFAMQSALASTGSTNGLTAVATVSAPGAGNTRQLKYFNLFNADTAPITATIRYNDNGTVYKLIAVTLQIGEALTYNMERGWTVNDVNGNLKTAIGTLVPPNLGGTGVGNNPGSTLTITGAYAWIVTLTGPTGVTFPTGGTLATLAGVETLTNKSLTSPSITGGTLAALTGLAVRDTSAAHDVTFAATSSVTLTADHSITHDCANANRIVKYTGNPTLADWFDQSVKVAASPLFANVTLGTSGHLLLHDGGGGGSGASDTGFVMNANGGAAFYLGSGQSASYTGGGSGGTPIFSFGSNGNFVFGSLSTSASAANAFINTGTGQTLLISTSTIIRKTNIRRFDTERSGPIVDALSGVLYNSLCESDDPGRDHYGMIAEWGAVVAPELVNWIPTEQRDQSGRVPDGYTSWAEYIAQNERDGMVPDGWQYERVSALLVEEVKQLRADRSTMQHQIALLSERLAAAGL